MKIIDLSKIILFAALPPIFLPGEPQTATLRIDPSRVPAVDEGVKQYVYLIAKSLSNSFPFQKETVILMSYKSGYVFIQTDKPIYTPDHEGGCYRYREFKLVKVLPHPLPLRGA